MNDHPRRRLMAPFNLAWAAHAASSNASFATRLRFDPEGPLLLLSPHLDDAVIDCWSVLVSDEEVAVVNVFAALPISRRLSDWDRLCRGASPRERARERLREDAHALAAAGRRPVNLPIRDHQYRRLRGRLPYAMLDRELVKRVPSARMVLAPLGIGHPDHRIVRGYADRILRSGVPVTLYGEVPHGALRGWPHWVTGEAEDPYLDPEVDWGHALDGLRGGGPPARVTRLSEEEAAAKLAAIRLYRSQFSALDGGPAGLLSSPLVHGFEVFWELNPEAARPSTRRARPARGRSRPRR